MPKVSTYNIAGAQTGEIELNDSVFGVEVNEAVMRQAVLRQLANERLGTHSTKNQRFGSWRRQETLETKRNRPGPCRQHPQPVVGWRRHHLGSPSAFLRSENAS